jgi:hypothetical protein
MGIFRNYLLNEKAKAEAFLIEEQREVRSKDDYIFNAEEGLIVAFRLNFASKDGVNLTKVISGKIVENNKIEEIYTVETRNGLKYGVPYQSVVWVKTGERWPKGVYDEMKQGSVAVKEKYEDDITEFGELDDSDI